MRTALLLPLAGCALPELAPLMHMTGSAYGEVADGTAAECALDLIFEVAEETGKGTWDGTHGGEVVRVVQEPDLSGFEFHADVFGEVEYEVGKDDFLEVRIPINETAEGRFWTEMAAFTGTIDDEGVGTGPWTCAPLDIDQGGYVDNEVLADGTWELAPIEE